MKKYELKYFGNPVLRQKAKTVEKITSEIVHLVESMIDLMNKHRGCGLAATQVGELLRIYISNVEYEDEQGEVHLGEPKVYINPVLADPSEVLVERSEGCLSIPKIYLLVKRPQSIRVTALDLGGNSFTRECHGFLARNMMHENDHLNGVLFIDRIESKARREIEPQLKKIKQQYA